MTLIFTSSLHEQRLQAECDQVSPLQSWAPEMRNFVQLQQRPIQNDDCDIIIEKPTFIMKIDAGGCKKSKRYFVISIQSYKKYILTCHHVTSLLIKNKSSSSLTTGIFVKYNICIKLYQQYTL